MIRIFVTIILFIPFVDTFSQMEDASKVFENSIDKVGLVTDGGGRFGSGFFVNSNTFITNYHVIDILSKNYIFIRVRSGEEYPAEVVSTDSKRDLAILKIKSKVEYLKLVEPDEIKQGDKVYALGNTGTVDAKIFDFNITEGIVSNIKYDTFYGKNLRIQAKVILHSATINSGNSGGPLVTSNGTVAGVNSFYYTLGNNLYFAIHTSELINFLKENNIKYYTKSKTDEVNSSSLFNPIIILIIIFTLLIIGFVVFLLINKKNKNSIVVSANNNLTPEKKIQNIRQNQFEKPLNQFSGYNNASHEGAYIIYRGKNQPINNNFFIVGRDTSCNLVLDDITASRQHFAIIRQKDDYILKDLNSKNGTYLNGIRVKSSSLKNADIIKVGSTTLIFSK